MMSLPYVSRTIRDRHLLLVGYIFMTLSSLLFLAFVIYANFVPFGKYIVSI